MSDAEIPQRVRASMEAGKMGPLFIAKSILGDRMQWIGAYHRNPSGGNFKTSPTCWQLDGSGMNATHAEILVAAGMPLDS